MRARLTGFLIFAVLGVGLAACGGSHVTVHLPPARLRVFGAFTGSPTGRTAVSVRRFTHESDGLGRSFMAPSDLAPAQIDFAAPSNGNPDNGIIRGGRHQRLGPSVSAFMVHPNNVELLVLGPHSEHVALTWEESCGFFRLDGGGSSAWAGAEAGMSLRLPAVVHVTLPRWHKGSDACLFSAVAAAAQPSSVQLEAVNY